MEFVGLQYLMYEALVLKVAQQKGRQVYASVQICCSFYMDYQINAFLYPFTIFPSNVVFSLGSEFSEDNFVVKVKMEIVVSEDQV